MLQHDPDIEWRNIESIIPYIHNVKKHPDAQIDKIAGSIAEFGFDQPIVIDADGVIIKGHGRLIASKKLKITQVPVIVRNDLSPAQVKAARIADNRVAESEWDNDLLALELKELADLDFDLGLTGFDPQELTSLMLDRTAVGETDPDDAPGIPENPVSVLGDVWIMGSLGHRIVCGDCTDPAVVATCLNGVKPNLMVTDPPYGVEYDANWRNNVVRKNGSRVGDKIGGRAVGKVMNDDQSDWRKAWALFPGNVCYVWHAGIKAASVEESLRSVKFTVRAQIVWVKTRFVISRGNYHPQHEPAYYATRDADAPIDDGWQDRYEPEHTVSTYAVRDGKTADWKGGRKQSTVWFVEHVKSDTGHSTQKPVEVMKRPIENNSSVGQAVIDPFSGSGTTLMACERLGLCARVIEMAPGYVDVCCRRWCEYTGKKAVHAVDGREFPL